MTRNQLNLTVTASPGIRYAQEPHINMSETGAMLSSLELQADFRDERVR
jgi:hypothetical protein